ncbi:Vacuolar calcium ion transporter [Tolypocladium ophioglossoides CBS 100239]|uniref:Vacuolar calcium ion transporter n=1 Tax=Tolypocladium ophioglossoides (strain CBS 100239) TaxID=1163406 RepID=A0A0L0MZD3_TOLOC|nr:Vacuolar calcium ion transporter [Tolypocladium ophioglossoides CBS 100239]
MSESEPFLSHAAEPACPRDAGRDAVPRWRILRLLRHHLVGLNVLLVFVPLGFVAAQLGWHDVLVSTLNFLAIIPLSALLSDASDTIGNRWGSLVGGLVNATFGNTVELIVGIMAIGHGELGVAQSIMLGSILSDILMVLGFCIIIAARSTGVIAVNSAVVDSLSSLMLMSAMALVLPTALYSTFPDTTGGIDISISILSFSRATVAVLLLIYLAYLYFQLKTHSSLFTEDRDDADRGEYSHVPDAPVIPTAGGQAQEDGEEAEGVDDTPSMREVSIAAVVLIISGVLIGKCTHSFMQRLDSITQALGITKTFVAIILIPVASNAPELTQVVAAARKQKIDFAIGVIIGSILQISLFTYILLFAVILVNQVLQDRQYTYLHGVMLLCV